MKSETKKALFFIFLIATYSLQAIVRNFSFPYIYILGFTFSTVCIYIVKNKYLSFFIGIATMLIMNFYDTDYKYMTVIAFCLICAHKSLMSLSGGNRKSRKQTDSFSFLLVQASLILSVLLFVYSLVLIISSEKRSFVISSGKVLLISIWIVGILLYCLFVNKSKKNNVLKKDRQLSGSLCYMYIVCFIGFSSTLLFTCADYNSRLNMPTVTVLFPWFVYICSMVYNGDPYIIAIANSIEKTLNKISDKSKVKQ